MPSTHRESELNALSRLRTGEQDVAIRQLDELINASPDHGSLWLARAIAKHSIAKWNEALVDIENAMTLMPLPIKGQLVLADCYARTGHSDLAIMAYEHLLGNDSLTSDNYADIYAGFRFCERQDRALETCRKAVAAEPENHAAYFGMAHCMVRLNYAANYIASVLRKASGLEPKNSAYQISLAIQLMRCGELKEAYSAIESVSIQSLQAVECLCSIRKLIELCVWSGDIERCHKLVDQLDMVKSKESNQQGDNQ